MKHHDAPRHVFGPFCTESAAGTTATPVLTQWDRDEMVPGTWRTKRFNGTRHWRMS